MACDDFVVCLAWERRLRDERRARRAPDPQLCPDAVSLEDENAERHRRALRVHEIQELLAQQSFEEDFERRDTLARLLACLTADGRTRLMETFIQPTPANRVYRHRALKTVRIANGLESGRAA